MPRSQPVGYYLKHEINKKLIEGLIGNQRYNDSLLATRLGIAEDVLVEIAGYIYPVDFVILDVKEDKKKPFILGTPFLAMAKAEISFDKEIITLKSGKKRSGYRQKDRKPSQNDKTEHGMEKTVQNQGPKSKNAKVRVNTEESQSNRSRIEEYY
ncbi:reverse transcriptase domain-containing protein [Tanacetum coccineum]